MCHDVTTWHHVTWWCHGGTSWDITMSQHDTRWWDRECVDPRWSCRTLWTMETFHTQSDQFKFIDLKFSFWTSGVCYKHIALIIWCNLLNDLWRHLDATASRWTRAKHNLYIELVSPQQKTPRPAFEWYRTINALWMHGKRSECRSQVIS